MAITAEKLEEKSRLNNAIISLSQVKTREKFNVDIKIFLESDESNTNS